MMLILLAARHAMWGKPAWQIGALLGLACNVKLVPVIAIPLFFFWQPSWRGKAQLVGGTLVPLLLGYGYHLTHCFAALKRNVFDYASDASFWGLPGLHVTLGMTEKGWALAGHMRMPLLVLLAIIGLGFGRHANRIEAKRRPAMLLVGLAWIFLTFLVLASGFGVQYLSWLNVVFPFLSLAGMVGYNLVAGTFLYKMYDFWHRGGSWTPNDVEMSGYPVGNELFWSHITWLFLALWAIWGLGLWWGRRRQMGSSPDREAR
jgi:hypothetical protein